LTVTSPIFRVAGVSQSCHEMRCVNAVAVLEPGYRRYGYIWGVYVEPDWRRRGLARQLTETTLTYLRDLACTRVILNASPSGRPVYESMGFQPSNEMRLNLEKVG